VMHDGRSIQSNGDQFGFTLGGRRAVESRQVSSFQNFALLVNSWRYFMLPSSAYMLFVRVVQRTIKIRSGRLVCLVRRRRILWSPPRPTCVADSAYARAMRNDELEQEPQTDLRQENQSTR
jgi:hypothetical protein